MRVWKQWTDDYRTTRKTGSGRWKRTSERDDQHLLHMAVNDSTASSGLLAARWSNATSVLIAWQADWHQVVFSEESRFNLWDHDDRIRVRRYAGERYPPECVIERHSCLKPRIMFWGAILYHGRSKLLRIEGNLNSNRYVHEVLSLSLYSPKSFPSFKASLELSFSMIMLDHMLQRLFEASVEANTCNFFLGLLIRWICCLLSTCGIWLVGVLLVIHVLQLQKRNFCCAYKQYGILFQKQRKEASENSLYCVGFPSHNWTANNLNEKFCWPVGTKTYTQCKYIKGIYSPPDGEQDTALELGSDVPAYCLQAPME
ncbi:transposable element Tc1 transposase [Trichonephila clavipes]|nr:transposable element Tc1 transposase [Trichonephila clavipes]